MADTPSPQGSGDTTATAATDGAEDLKYTESQYHAGIEAKVNERLKNLKKQLAERDAKIVALQKTAPATPPPPDDDDEPEPGGGQPAAPTPPAQPSVALAKLERRLRQAQATWETERQELLSKLEQESKAHKSTRIKQSVLEHLSKVPGVRDANLVLRLTSDDLAIDDGGNVVAKGPDGDELQMGEFYARWLKEHSLFLESPPAGTGDRPGRAATAPRKSPGEKTEAECYRAGVQDLFGQAKK